MIVCENRVLHSLSTHSKYIIAHVYVTNLDRKDINSNVKTMKKIRALIVYIL